MTIPTGNGDAVIEAKKEKIEPLRHATLLSADHGHRIAEQLQMIHTLRKRLTAEQVTYLREAVLLDGIPVKVARRNIHPPISASAVWAVVRARTYRNVPLSPRLRRAWKIALEKRKVPIHAENLLPEEPE